MKTMQQAQQMLKAYKQVFTYAYLLPGEKLEQGLAHAGPGQAPTKERRNGQKMLVLHWARGTEKPR